MFSVSHGQMFCNIFCNTWAASNNLVQMQPLQIIFFSTILAENSSIVMHFFSVYRTADWYIVDCTFLLDVSLFCRPVHISNITTVVAVCLADKIKCPARQNEMFCQTK